MCKRCLVDGQTDRHPGRPIVLTSEERQATKLATDEWWKKDHPDRFKFLQRRSWLKRYGLTIEAYEQLLKDQGGHCAICPTTPEENGNNLSVDHDHACCPPMQGCAQCVRGLLCKVCNRDMGRIDKYREGFVAYLGLARS